MTTSFSGRTVLGSRARWTPPHLPPPHLPSPPPPSSTTLPLCSCLPLRAAKRPASTITSYVPCCTQHVGVGHCGSKSGHRRGDPGQCAGHTVRSWAAVTQGRFVLGHFRSARVDRCPRHGDLGVTVCESVREFTDWSSGQH